MGDNLMTGDSYSGDRNDSELGEGIEAPTFVELAMREKSPPGLLSTQTAVIKRGQRVYKIATVSEYGRERGAVSKRELRLDSYPARKDGTDYDVSQRGPTWYCENTEIERLRLFLSTQLEQSGDYLLIPKDSPALPFLRTLEQGGF